MQLESSLIKDITRNRRILYVINSRNLCLKTIKSLFEEMKKVVLKNLSSIFISS